MVLHTRLLWFAAGLTVSLRLIRCASSGTFNAAAVMTFNAMLSDAQIDEIYDYMVLTMAGRGITVAWLTSKGDLEWTLCRA